MENILDKLNRDLKKASENLSDREARYLVDLYYQMQDFRIQATNQTRILTKEDAEEPHEVIGFMGGNYKTIEDNIKACLKVYAESKPVGRWMLSICGIGPVIAAGLLAHIDIKKCETAGAIWSFAGLVPDVEWCKGQKRPWNAKLKVLCWKIGQSFMKVSSNDKDYYGKIYLNRKEYEAAKNEAGEYKEIAEKMLATKVFKKKTKAKECYEKGILPPAHIDARARRYAVKLFLSHLHAVWYELDRGTPPPKPFAISILGHAHEVPIPNREFAC